MTFLFYGADKLCPGFLKLCDLWCLAFDVWSLLSMSFQFFSWVVTIFVGVTWVKLFFILKVSCPVATYNNKCNKTLLHRLLGLAIWIIRRHKIWTSIRYRNHLPPTLASTLHLQFRSQLTLNLHDWLGWKERCIVVAQYKLKREMHCGCTIWHPTPYKIYSSGV